MTSVVSPSSTATSTATVYLRRDQTTSGSFRRPPAVRSLVLSDLFLPLENTSPVASFRSRSACRSCLLVEPSFQEQIPLPPSGCKKSASSTLQRSDSLLSRLQSLFIIKRPPGSHAKTKKPPVPPKIQPPLMTYDSFSSRARSQSTASRNHHRSLKTTSAQASPARSVVNEPLVCNTPSPKVSTHTPLTSFAPSPAKLQRPKNFPMVQRRQKSNPTSQQKYLSAHLPGEALPSQSSSGLWSASSVTSLGMLPQQQSIASNGRSGKAPSAYAETRSFLRFRRRSPSSSSSNDSAVDLPGSIKSDWSQRQWHAKNDSIYTKSSRIYEEVTSSATPGLAERTPTTTQPCGFARSVSTMTLTSVETERTEPTYAVPLSNGGNTTSFGPLKPPAPPPVPPRAGICRLEMEDPSPGTMPAALTASPQAPVYVEKTMPQRRATSALRVSYQRSPCYDDSMSGRRPASTVSPSDLTTTDTYTTNNTIISSSGSSWYADILPYNPSNLPDTLADRLKQQRNSFILSAPPPSSSQGDNLMTRSLFEPRQTPSESCAWPLPSGRSSSRTRPVSFHDAPSISINLPSLDHLLKPSETRKISAPATDVNCTSPLKNLFLQEPMQHVQPTDSPLLGQYGRLKLVIPPAAPSSMSYSTSSRSGSQVAPTASSNMCSTFIQSTSRF